MDNVVNFGESSSHSTDDVGLVDNIEEIGQTDSPNEVEQPNCLDCPSSPEEWPPRKHKRTAETVPSGDMNFISSKFESMDFEKSENYLTLDEERSKGFQFVLRQNLTRWFIFFLIGVTTAVVGAIVDIGVEQLSEIKFTCLKGYVDSCVRDGCLYIPYLMWAAMNIGFVFMGSVLVAYVEPVAAGSGIPQVKCYLNGVKIPRVVRIKTLFVKVFGVITSVVGGLAVGKEGPMIHSGAVVGAGLSQGKSTSLKIDSKFFRYFRQDCEKRDFVSGGAAAGVSAAFGAPIGGVLFSLEEGISFWHQSLTWKLFFCSLVSTVTLNLILSAYHGRFGELTYSGLLDFGRFDFLAYQIVELPIFMAMGIIGGLLGALFNQINLKITVFRIRCVHLKCLKVVEAILVAAVTATIGFLMMYLMNDCRPNGQDPTKIPVQMYCGDGYYNALAALWFQTPEASVRSLFHDPIGSHRVQSILLFFLFYLFLSCWTYGLSVSSGVFIPSLLTGAAWGRMVGMGLSSIFPGHAWVDPGKYALIGAAAQLGGVVRMTLCLTVILIEATGNISFGLPLMITLITAKWTGDYFNEGIYDIHTQLQGVPVLGWEAPPLSSNVYASEIMSYPVTAFCGVERVSRIIQVLKEETHNGFPVVDMHSDDELSHDGIQRVRPYGRLRGLILRYQLIVILKHKLFNEASDQWCHTKLPYCMFRDQYPCYDNVEDIQLDASVLDYHIDLRPFMNQSPYSVQHSTSLPRVFRLFRALGLRHLPVVNDCHEVIGMVTRKDLARYRVPHGSFQYEELKISQKL